jgi:hypothetical protein
MVRVTRVIGIVLLIVAGYGCAEPEGLDLVYQVQAWTEGGTLINGAIADIAYLRAVDDTVRITGATLPWQMRLATDVDKPVYLWAQSDSPERRVLSVAIFVDGAALFVDQQTGEFVIASTYGTVP